MSKVSGLSTVENWRLNGNWDWRSVYMREMSYWCAEKAVDEIPLC